MTEDVEQILTAAMLTAELFSQASTHTTMFLTGVSGYLLVAYFQGKNLTRLQVTIITVLFIYYSIAMTLAATASMQEGVYWGKTYGLSRAPSYAAHIIGTVQFFGMLAALKFMWDVRHSKSE